MKRYTNAEKQAISSAKNANDAYNKWAELPSAKRHYRTRDAIHAKFYDLKKKADKGIGAGITVQQSEYHTIEVNGVRIMSKMLLKFHVEQTKAGVTLILN